MAYAEIIYRVTDGVAIVTLNRPDKLNAWTGVMEGEVRAAMHAASGDDAVRVIVLTGAGRGFCAGADMQTLQDIQSDNRAPARSAEAFDPKVRDDFSKTYSYFPSVPKPIIAAVNGPCAGLGLVIALYADMRFASDAAVFTTAFSRRGLIAEHGVSWLLPRLVGVANAADLLFSARRVLAPRRARSAWSTGSSPRSGSRTRSWPMPPCWPRRSLRGRCARSNAKSGTPSSKASARRSTPPTATWPAASSPRTSRRASLTIWKNARPLSPAARSRT